MGQELFRKDLLKLQECDCSEYPQVESGHIVDDLLADARDRAGDPPVRKPTPPEFIELDLGK